MTLSRTVCMLSIGVIIAVMGVYAHAQSSYSIGTRVQTTAKLNVRATPNGAKLGTQPKGALGTIVSGPQNKSGNTWWNIDYDSGPDGWSAEAYLVVTSASSGGSYPPPPTPPPTSGDCSGPAQHVPGGPDGTGTCWPGPTNTGVPAGTTLTNYTGPCTITGDNTVIDSKTINCNPIEIQAKNVVIKNSRINGQVYINSDDPRTQYNLNFSLTLQDSEVNAPMVEEPAVFEGAITAIRANIHGGITSVQCGDKAAQCIIQDSWLHGQLMPSGVDWHLGGFHSIGGTNYTMVHNSIVCDTPVNNVGGGCSGDIVFIPYDKAISHALVQHDLLGANKDGSYCTYTGNKPGFTATYMVYKDNVFQRGTNGLCGAYGPIDDWSNATGNVWSNNQWDDGKILNSDGSTGATASAPSSSPAPQPSPTPSPTPAASGSTITIGETIVLPTDDSGNGSLLLVQQATLSQTATLQSLSFYVNQAAGNLRLGIYDASGPSGGPGALKASTNAFAPTAGWNTQPVMTPITLSSGTYWLAYLPSSSSLHFSNGGGGQYRYAKQAFGKMPATFPAIAGTGGTHWSLYATLTINTASVSASSQLASSGTVAEQLAALKALLLDILEKIQTLLQRRN